MNHVLRLQGGDWTFVGDVQENPGKRLWHTPRVKISGIPEGDAWPRPEQLISLLRTAPGRPVTTQVRGPTCTSDCVILGQMQ